LGTARCSPGGDEVPLLELGLIRFTEPEAGAWTDGSEQNPLPEAAEPEWSRVVVERLQPSLLDRLISEDPQGADTWEEQVWSSAKLRGALLRDLEFLLNTSCAHSREAIHGYPHASRFHRQLRHPRARGQFSFQREPDALAGNDPLRHRGLRAAHRPREPLRHRPTR